MYVAFGMGGGDIDPFSQPYLKTQQDHPCLTQALNLKNRLAQLEPITQFESKCPLATESPRSPRVTGHPCEHGIRKLQLFISKAEHCPRNIR